MFIDKDSYFLFSGGEVHLNIEAHDSEIVVTDYTMNGFMALAQYVELFRRKFSHFPIRVTYPYLPYARQDRAMADDAPFSLKVFCQLLNSLNLDSVTIMDPHSDVAPAIIDNCIVVPQWEIAKKVIPEGWFEPPEAMFVSPDAGAYKKLSKLVADDWRICIGTKIRDSHGMVNHTKVHSPVNLEGLDCLIVDDICDGGRTFIEISKALKANGAASVSLYVTHGIFSNGFEELQKHLNKIFTTNTFPHPDAPTFVTVKEII